MKNKEKLQERSKEYYKNNYKGNEDLKVKNSERYYKNKDKIIEKSRKYSKENREKINETRRKYNEKNSERIKERRRIYNEGHKEVKRLWQQNNKDKVNIQKQARRASKKELPNTLNEKQWNMIKEKFNNKCCYCGEETPLEQEHFIPISKGGEYTVNNIIPACKRCNCSKNNSDFVKWYIKQKFYSKKREQLIFKHLSYKEDNQQLSLI